MKYWSGKGQYQDLYEKYWKELVPDMGEADTTEGEALRAIARINHDIYNNGGGNIVEVDAVYDDDGDHYADEYSISSFYDDFFDKVAMFTGDHMGVREFKRMVEDLGADYWDGRLNDTVDSFIDRVVQKIDSQLVAK